MRLDALNARNDPFSVKVLRDPEQEASSNPILCRAHLIPTESHVPNWTVLTKQYLQRLGDFFQRGLQLASFDSLRGASRV